MILKEIQEINDSNLHPDTKIKLFLQLDKAVGDSDIVARLEEEIRELEINLVKTSHSISDNSRRDLSLTLILLGKILHGKFET